MIQRCAAYARYSSDLQSPRSIEDQLRICREYARAHGFVFLEEHVYTDEALSGVGADRPGLGRMLDAALSPARPFDVILLDDSSRLARNTKDALGIFQLCRSRHSWKNAERSTMPSSGRLARNFVRQTPISRGILRSPLN